jgi:hypothetical protein
MTDALGPAPFVSSLGDASRAVPCFYFTRSHGCCHAANDRKPTCRGVNCGQFRREDKYHEKELRAEALPADDPRVMYAETWPDPTGCPDEEAARVLRDLDERR